jgi:hypothetical protein
LDIVENTTMTKKYSTREAIENALNNSLRYERLGYCSRCEEVHTESKHLGAIALIADEVYLWLGFGKEKPNLRLYTRIIKTLEDAPITGQREKDINEIARRLVDDYGLAGR